MPSSASDHLPSSSKSSTSRGDGVAPWPARHVLVHWFTVLLLSAGVGAVLWRAMLEERAWRAVLLDVHRYAGVLVFAVTWLRMSWRLTGPRRAPTEHTVWLRAAAAIAHGLLYLGLLALPLIGWALSDARGQPLHPFGLGLPSLMAADPDWADSLEEVHAATAWTLFALIALHVVAACWHHWVRRDGVLLAMTRFHHHHKKAINE